MHFITNIGTHLSAVPPQAGGNTSPGQSGNGFQLAVMTRPSAQPAQGVSAGISSSLGSQTASVLLQTQDLNQQTQAHGGGGGGGHHGGMKMLNGLEAEEAGESEEAQQLRQRKKLTKTIKPSDMSESAEIDENDVPVTNGTEQSDTDLSKREDEVNSGI